MTVKKASHKNARQKKVLQMVSEAQAKDGASTSGQNLKHDEEAIRRQLLTIKKDYNRLIEDVAEGYGLIRQWVGVQAATRGELLKSRFIKN